MEKSYFDIMEILEALVSGFTAAIGTAIFYHFEIKKLKRKLRDYEIAYKIR